MNVRVVGLLLLSVELFCGCKEDHSLVNLSNSGVQSKDTTYVLPAAQVPAHPDPHNVLFEDYTGVTCPNCPVAHDYVLLPILNTHPGRINVVAYFITGFSQTDPNPGQLHDFRSSVATSVANKIFLGIAGLPCAGIDRMPFGDNTAIPLEISSSKWTASVTNLLPIQDSLNLLVSSTYNASDSMATIIAQITYLQPNFGGQNLSIAIVEDSLQDLQEFIDSVAMYHFDGVFRDLVTSVPYGDPIFPTVTPKEIGRFCQKVYSYKVKSAWNVKNCRVVAWVHNTQGLGASPVFQSWQCRLAP
jgi:Outer membrane protein Omp28